ncbi:MAG: hypothetical protein GEV07_07350 [Streptosporangiales bacterium]|nr:hypothetical protein [Streptosporangiales bacterium]
MIDQPIHTKAALRSPALSLPSQAVPVTRAGAGGASGGGVEADGLFDDIVRGVGTVAQTALPILGGFGI